VALALLVLLDALMFRNVLAGGLPSGVDSPFTYGLLPFFAAHGLHTFSVWLPEPFGQVQQFSLYWLLAAVQGIVPSATIVYDAALFFAVLLVSVGMYCLAFWLTRSVTAAAMAAAIYSCSPFLVAQILAGHLDIIVAYGVGPIALLTAWVALRTGKASAMIGLGLSAAVLFLLTTGQGAYWALPILIIGVSELVAPSGGAPRRRIALRAMLVGTVALATFLAASAVQLVPTVAGESAAYAGGSQHYFIQGLSIHAKYSLPFRDNALGIPRELYLDPSLSITAAPFSSWPFRLAALLLLVLAVLSLRNGSRFRRVAAILAVPVPIAWLLASGPHGPLPGLYRMYYNHVPYATFLRVPNRWLMISETCVALMIALTVAGLPSHAAKRRRFHLSNRAAIRTAGALLLFMCTFGLLHGLPSWSPPSAEGAAYAPLRQDRSDWRILTTPYYQSWMNALRGSDLTLQADAGTVSTWWHGRSVVGRGGWDPRAARFALYLEELVEQGANRDVTKLLGAAGVKYIALYPQPPLEVNAGQNTFFKSQHFLRHVSDRGGVTIYRNTSALPQAYVTRESCVIAGGLHVLGDLAEQPWFSFRQVGVEFADQLAAVSGRAGLVEELRHSRCLIIAPGGANALGVLLNAVSVADLADSAPAAWVGTDTSPSLDIGAEPTPPVYVPTGRSLAVELRLAHEGSYRIFIAGLHSPAQEKIAVEVNGRPAGSIGLRSIVGSGFEWSASQAQQLARGRQVVRLRVIAPSGTLPAELTKIAIVPADAGLASLSKDHLHVVHETGGVGPLDFTARQLSARQLRVKWNSAAPKRYVRVLPRSKGGVAIAVRHAGRHYFTVARGYLSRAVNPDHLLALRFRGAGSGRRIHLNFAYSLRGAPVAGFSFIDSTRRPRILAFSPLQPGFARAVPNWTAARVVMLATDSKKALKRPMVVLGLFQLRRPSVRPAFTNAASLASTSGSKLQNALATSSEMISTEAGLKHRLPRGLLVFTQSYNKGWALRPDAGADHTAVLGFANGYRLSHPTDARLLSFGPAVYGRIGTYLSMAAWIIGLALIIRFVRREQRGNRAAHEDV
jgi:hypothetical protein